MTTTLIQTAHRYNPTKLATVMDEMQVFGAPTVRAVDVGDSLLALEGVHRLEAAHRLGLTPTIVVLAYDDAVPTDIDLDNGAFAGFRVADAVEYILSGDGPTGASYDVEVA